MTEEEKKSLMFVAACLAKISTFNTSISTEEEDRLWSISAGDFEHEED